jgi:CRP/FNR family transcriptional regulator, anaerobic regulatory protein
MNHCFANHTVRPIHPTPVCDALQIALPALVELVGGSADAACSAGLEHFSMHRVSRGETLVHEGAVADCVYVVQVGSFKSVRSAEDGYEYVLGFGLRGDILGYDGVAGGHFAFSAVALEDSRVVVLPLVLLGTVRRRVPAFDMAVQALLSRQITHAGEIAEVMAAVAADVRLARFLVQLSGRMAERGQSARRLRLCMNRRDIANHLGLAHETISRCFRLLSDRGWLNVDNREVELLDFEGLRRCARSTRGLADDDGLEPPHMRVA